MLENLRRRSRDAKHTDARLSSAPPAPSGIDFYGPATAGATTIGRLATTSAVLDDVLALLARLEQDDYIDYVRNFVESGRAVAGDDWRYADITTVLAAATRLLRPQAYLEIGVRRGRSLPSSPQALRSALSSPSTSGTRGMRESANPGPEHVRGQLGQIGHTGSLRFVTGDSHVELPRLFAAEPDLTST